MDHIINSSAANEQETRITLEELNGKSAAFDSALYAKVKNYVGQDNTVYTLTGRIGRYYDQPELVVDSYTFEDETLTDLASFSSFEEKSLSEIKSEIASLPISEKGVSYGRPIVFNAKYVDELVQENLLFGDNELTIQLHGSSKISNSFVKGNNYKVAALLGLHIYKPSLTFLGIVSNEASTTFNPAVSPLSASELYNVKYTKDSASHATNYENVFYSWRRFRGYVSCYQKDGKSFFVLDDTASREFSSYTAALNAKTIFVNNESEKNIYSQADANGSILLDYYQNETEIIIDYVPYLYNTNRYWQIFANLSSISVAE